MDANKIETMKALALAATPGPWYGDRMDGTVKYTLLGGDHEPVIRGDNGNSDSGPFGIDKEEDEAYLLGCHPAAVLELIAEVKRLRAELAAGAAREGGNTSESAGQLDHAKTAETRMNSGFEGGHLGSVPAAPTITHQARQLIEWAYDQGSRFGDEVTSEVWFYEAEESGSIAKRLIPVIGSTPAAGTVEKDVARLADGYQGSTMVSDSHGPKITMRYSTTAQADAAHEVIASIVDAAMAHTKGKDAA